jgi:hypothetical protein
MKMYWGSSGIPPRILDLRTRWRWVVSLTPWLLYSQGKSPWYPMDRRLWGPEPFWMQQWRGKFPTFARNQTLNPDHPACSLVTVPTEMLICCRNKSFVDKDDRSLWIEVTDLNEIMSSCANFLYDDKVWFGPHSITTQKALTWNHNNWPTQAKVNSAIQI